jgi:uncharacterized protein (DUF2236 family)
VGGVVHTDRAASSVFTATAIPRALIERLNGAARGMVGRPFAYTSEPERVAAFETFLCPTWPDRTSSLDWRIPVLARRRVDPWPAMAESPRRREDPLVATMTRPAVRSSVAPVVLAPVASTVRRIISGSSDGATATNRAIARPAGAPGWFGPDSAVWQVHGSVSTFLGGIRSLLLQSLHPLALAGVDGHSSYRDDPFGRLHRTGAFIAATTFGSQAMAQQTVEAIGRIHQRVAGTAPDGRPYAATDPALLTWIHIALVDSMLEAYLRFGTNGHLAADDYVADMAVIGAAMGVPSPPTTHAELHEAFREVRPDLAGSAHVDDVRGFVLHPPLSTPARMGYSVLARAAEDSLQPWARQLLGSPARSSWQRRVNAGLASAMLTTLQEALVESPARAAARVRLGVTIEEMERLQRERGPVASA